MANTSKAVKSAAELLAEKADTAATWVSGPRANALRQLADDIRKLGEGDTDSLLARQAEQEEAAEKARAEQEAAEAAREASRKAAAEAAKAAQKNS